METQTQRPLGTTLRTTGARVISDTDTFNVREDNGEVNATKLAENIAWELNHDEWLDDETHEVWDVAMALANKANK